MNKYDLTKDIETIKKLPIIGINKYHNTLVTKHPRARWLLPSLAVLILVICAFVFWLYSDPIKLKTQSILGIKTSNDKVIPLDIESNTSKEEEIEEKISDEYIKSNQCNNYPINIIGTKYILPIGSQRFHAENGGYSASDTKDFQASSETSWGCSLPFTAQIVSIPISGSSFGLSFEYFNMFKVVIGDGDRKTIRVEENKYGIRGAWPEIKDETGKIRPSLVNPIEDGEEVTLTIKAKHLDGKIKLNIVILHSKFKSKEEYNFEFEPTAVNFQSDQSRKFRIGINDSRYKGEGSVIDLKTFSIKEGEW